MGYFILVVVLAVLALYLFSIRSDTLPEQFSWVEKRNFAHRGYYTKDQSIPENSIAAFRRAISSGYGIELDVQLSKDGKLFVFHDDDLKRMVNASSAIVSPSAKVTDMDYSILSSYYLGHSQEIIPLLADVLQIVSGKVPLYIEVKEFSTNCEAVCRSLISTLSKYEGPFAIASFNPFVLRYMRKHAPHWMRIQISQNYKHSQLPLWQKFMLENLMFNWITRPHAISYHYSSTNLSYRICRVFMMYTLGWSIPDRKAYQKYSSLFDGVVFEHFEAPRLHN